MNTEETIFTKIINGDIPAARIYEDEHCIVIPDKFPTAEGQVLVITKQQVSYIFDLDDDIYTHIFGIAKKISRVLDKTYSPERTCLVVEGFEVPHVHIKLYPIQKENHLDISGGKEISNEEAEEITEKIKKGL